jgi:large subunit ribosomal protein L7/L12
MASTTLSIATTIRSSSYPTLASINHFPSRTTTIEFPSRFGGGSSSTLTHRATHLRPIAAVEAPEKIEKIGSEISSLTLEEARILVDYLQDKFGVSPLSLAPAAAAVAAPADGGAAAVVEEQTEFDFQFFHVSVVAYCSMELSGRNRCLYNSTTQSIPFHLIPISWPHIFPAK